MLAARADWRLRRCLSRTGFDIPCPLPKTKGPFGAFVFLAERAGFEPAVRGYRTLAFQASALNHSATSPSVCTRKDCSIVMTVVPRCIFRFHHEARAEKPAGLSSPYRTRDRRGPPVSVFAAPPGSTCNALPTRTWEHPRMLPAETRLRQATQASGNVSVTS